MLETKELKIKIAPELLHTIEEAHAKKAPKQAFDSFIRGQTLPTLFAQLANYNAFVKNGRKWTFPNGEQTDLEIDGEPVYFDSFSESKRSKVETEAVLVRYSKRMYEKAYDCASFNNAILLLNVKRNPQLKLSPYKTVGDYFKEIIFIPTFVKEGDEDEKSELLEEEKELEKQFEKESKKK